MHNLILFESIAVIGKNLYSVENIEIHISTLLMHTLYHNNAFYLQIVNQFF